MMDQNSIATIDVAITRRAKAKTEIDIVEGNGKLFVETLYGVEEVATHRKACPGDGHARTRVDDFGRPFCLFAGDTFVQMAANATDAQSHAGVLD